MIGSLLFFLFSFFFFCRIWEVKLAEDCSFLFFRGVESENAAQLFNMVQYFSKPMRAWPAVCPIKWLAWVIVQSWVYGFTLANSAIKRKKSNVNRFSNYGTDWSAPSHLKIRRKPFAQTNSWRTSKTWSSLQTARVLPNLFPKCRVSSVWRHIKVLPKQTLYTFLYQPAGTFYHRKNFLLLQRMKRSEPYYRIRSHS